MKNVGNYSKKLILISSILLLVGCPSRHVPPKTELCVIGEHNLICNDQRLEKDDREYTIEFIDAKNYLCTNPDDYTLTENWVLDLINKLEDLEDSL